MQCSKLSEVRVGACHKMSIFEKAPPPPLRNYSFAIRIAATRKTINYHRSVHRLRIILPLGIELKSLKIDYEVEVKMVRDTTLKQSVNTGREIEFGKSGT